MPAGAASGAAGAPGLRRAAIALSAWLVLGSPLPEAVAGIPAGTPIARLQTTAKVIALSFDDGPRDTPVLDTLLAVLASRHAHATFFAIGSELERAPDAGRRLLAAGHELGNHTWTHARLDSIGPDSLRIELARTDSLLRALGARGHILVRPPFGAWDEKSLRELKRERRTVALFDVDPGFDFPGITDPDSIAAKTVDWLGPGSILVLHPWYDEGDEAMRQLPIVLDWLERLGYRIVTISELFRTRHAIPEVSLYHKAD